ncbi:MAG: hypothetical protein Q7R34_09675, partial [Dehalococcoidia bacterium]|nr:hypothetical protein [Dehalococcoidia bacterium]
LDNFFATRAFENVSVVSKDGSIKLTGAMLHDLLNPLRDYQEGIRKFEELGIPTEVSELLLKQSGQARLPLPDEDNTQQAITSLRMQNVPLDARSGSEKDELGIDANLTKINLSRLLEDPILYKCFTAYPQVKDFVGGKSYTLIKNKKEIGKDISWDKLAKELEKTSDRSGVTIQRYKGLGEMSAEQLWETTMNPDTRTLLTVNVENAVKADQVFQMLMGEEVPPRKAYIMAHAKSVTNLDI